MISYHNETLKMNISNRLRDYFVFPNGGFVHFPDTSGYIQSAVSSGLEFSHRGHTVDINYPTVSTAFVEAPRWRMDGSCFGVEFFATPLFLLPMPPLRIDIEVPDQLEWPAELWDELDAPDSVHMPSERVAQLGISRHLTRVLEHWSRQYPHFENEYRSLPFGSKIKLAAIKRDVADMEFTFVPNQKLPARLLSVEVLRNMWGLSVADMPSTIDLADQRLERQLQKSITLVSLASCESKKLLIFKARISGMPALYHEMKVLLTLPAHPNIIQRPLYLVTIYSPTHGEHRVCSFILRYHELGALQELLPQRLLNSSLKWRDQINWAQDVTSALRHVISIPGQFYSDLKMDNILVSSEKGREKAILVDFEQSRKLYTWAPPEVYYLEWIARSDELSAETKSKYSGILDRYLSSRGYRLPLRTHGPIYDNPPHG